jgi:hypothetical protein
MAELLGLGRRLPSQSDPGRALRLDRTGDARWLEARYASTYACASFSHSLDSGAPYAQELQEPIRRATNCEGE